MSALIQLGLSHFQSEPAAVSVDAQGWLERFATADEWLKKVFEGIEKLPKDFKDAGKLGEILDKAAPWIEAGSKAFPPAHLLFQIVSSLTKINDPRDLAILACTVAYQSVADKAIRETGLPERKFVKKRLRDSIGVTREEFAYFTIEGALAHPFVRRADEVLEFYAASAGYEDRQVEKLIATCHSRFREELRMLISDGENLEKFAPLRNWLGTDAKDAFVREALRRHVQYARWLFEEAPLLDEEPYALSNIYIDAGCGVLTRKELQEKNKDGRPVRDPFRRSEESGGVHSLLETVLGYIRNPDFNDVIVIQGSPGAGKSSFAKNLAATLAVDGLTPMLVRLRDASNIGQGLFRTIGDALRYQDEIYLRGAQEEFQPPPELLGDGHVFDDRVPYYGASICPYVLIMDGWDEISLDVADGYKQKIHALLAEIRQEFFRGRHPRVRVILSGRPSDAIDTAENFFKDDTPVLTLRQMTPEQLADFAGKLRAGVIDRPLQRYTSNWQMPSEDKLEPLFSKYEQGFRNESSETGGQVLGVPFLAQLAFRVIANPGPDGDRVADNPTTLLRRITEITVHHARLSTEYIQVGASPKFAERAICKKLHGDPLRRLLHRTAAKMTIAGRESVSHKELWDFLHASNDADLMEQAEGAGGISGLLIAFFFKGGNTQLGCEFTHKAFREYLFAEAVVECIKDLAKDQETTPNLGVRTHYWRDFSDEDPRQEWSRSLGELLAPQWLAPPVSAHITELLEWETRRAAADSYSEEVTQPLTPAEWKYVRDGIADVYDWWTEGVPMRPQLGVIPKKNETEWRPPYFQVLIEQQFERPSKPNILTVIPPRMTTYDGHLGAALMHLTAAIHVSVSEMVSQLGLTDAPRDGSRVQSLDKGGVIRFRPTGDRPEFFKWYCSRITAAGWYGHMFPDFEVGLRFPASAYLRGVDLGETHLQGEILVQTNLREAILARTALDSSFLFRADLSAADLSEASLDKARLVSAVLKRANFAEAELRGADLEGADLEGANLEGANLEGARIDPKTLSAKQLASLKGRP